MGKTVNFGNLRPRAELLAWRQRAVQLAIANHLDGKAYAISPGVVYGCVSLSRPMDYVVLYTKESGEVRCGCEAGTHVHACGHAGAVLLLLTGLVEENVRKPN